MPPVESEIDIEEQAAEPVAGAPVTIQLEQPIKMGSHTITELTLRFSPRAFKDFAIPVKEDGTVVFVPYVLASAGVRMAGHPDKVFEKLGAKDFMTVAQAAMSFLS